MPAGTAARARPATAADAGYFVSQRRLEKLQHLAVDNPAFKARCREQLGLGRVHNFYGMVEQVGSIFVECEQGHLHAPVFADVQVRDPLSHQPLGIGSPGLLQVLSAIPGSYPGHSLLSEDPVCCWGG